MEQLYPKGASKESIPKTQPKVIETTITIKKTAFSHADHSPDFVSGKQFIENAKRYHAPTRLRQGIGGERRGKGMERNKNKA